MERTNFDPRALDAQHYLLLDPARVEEEGAQSWEKLPLHVLAPSGFEAHARHLPYLLAWQDLNAEQRTLVQELLLNPDKAIAAPMCVAVLQTDALPGDVRRHLQHLLVPQFPGGGRGVFRFYDPVVLVHLGWMLDDRQRTVLFGPILTWTFPIEGRWFVAVPPSQGSSHVRFAPGADVWRRIARIGSLHAVLQTEQPWREEPALHGPQVEPWLIRAEGHSLFERDDVVAFARHGLLKHARFDSHPKVIAALKQSVGHPAHYRRTTSLWSDADWQVIVRDLASHPNVVHASTANTHRLTQGAQ